MICRSFSTFRPSATSGYRISLAAPRQFRVPPLAMIKCDSSMATLSSNSNDLNHYKRCEFIADNLFRSILEKTDSKPYAAVHIKDLENTRKKFDTLVARGSGSLQVVSDFDRTMSKFKHNDTLTPTCHGIFEMDPELTDEAKFRLTYLRDKYYPMEIDPFLADSEKIPYMIKWWNLSHETIVNCGLHRTALAKTVRDCGLVLRDGVDNFMDLLHKCHIPVLIFSAGLGDVIKLLLENFEMCKDNVRVVSNFMEFNENDLLVGFSDPIIHSFNKTAASIANGDYADISSKRPCVLLLGDSTGDVHMADGATVDDPEGVSGTVLRIGFLNEAVEANLERYKSIYDIVLVNDHTFNIPLAVMDSVLQCHQTVAAFNCRESQKQHGGGVNGSVGGSKTDPATPDCA